MTGKFQPGDLIKFKYSHGHGWKGLLATVTKVAQDQDGNPLIGYLTHGYHGVTTLDRIIPVKDEKEYDNA